MAVSFAFSFISWFFDEIIINLQIRKAAIAIKK
jgi:hypothetical protein